MPAACKPQAEEIEAICSIFDDAWSEISSDGSNVLHVPVPYIDGAATLCFKLPANYLVDPGALPRVTVDTIPPAIWEPLLAELQAEGLVHGGGTDKSSGGVSDPIIFQVVSLVRDQLSSTVGCEDFFGPAPSADADCARELERSSAGKGPSAPASPSTSADERADAEAAEVDADWRVFEQRKKEAARAAKAASGAAHDHADACDTDRDGTATADSNPAAGLRGKDAYIARLKAGESVSFREGGNSMTPKIKSRQLCTYAPVIKHEDANESDAVFCKVGGAYYTHLIYSKQLVRTGTNGAPDEYRFQIGNNHGHINGWTTLDKVYGRVIAIAP